MGIYDSIDALEKKLGNKVSAYCYMVIMAFSFACFGLILNYIIIGPLQCLYYRSCVLLIIFTYVCKRYKTKLVYKEWKINKILIAYFMFTNID